MDNTLLDCNNPNCKAPGKKYLKSIGRCMFCEPNPPKVTYTAMDFLAQDDSMYNDRDPYQPIRK